ncbi:subtilase family protein [Krasilnikovia cinnamomea]|uniref:Subtilase family protein n=1 Tax=Krasilnikovia cinnamomea TaxID=349313 RepID=A0A4Q7ZR39_9ACTN|nr:subtilase family protein [Krasilnikovia cinnamomea]
MAGTVSPAAAADTGPVRLDVGLAAGADPAAVVATLGDAVVRTGPVPGLDAITVDVAADQAEAALSQLGATPGVRYAERGAVVRADSDKISLNFGLMDIPPAWTWTMGDPGVTVAVVDTGVNPTDDLVADRLAAGYDVVDGDTDTADGNGHGTMAANLIAGDGTNGVGYGGLCNRCRIMPVRALSGPTGTTADLAAGIAWAADHGAQVVNVSLSTPAQSRLLRDAVEHAAAKGSLVVASAGNEASTARRYPAAYEHVLSVSQAGPTKNTAADRWVDVEAYGTWDVLGRNNTPVPLTGASGATALVSGVAALAFAMKPDATADEVRSAIQRNAELSPLHPPYGTPMVNAGRVIYDLGGVDTVAPTVTSTGLTENAFIPAEGVMTLPQMTDDHGIERYEVLVDGRSRFVVLRPGGKILVQPPANHSGPFPVTVRAYDYAGHVGEATTMVHTDTLAPTGRLLSPEPFKVVHSTMVDVTVKSSDTDLQSITSQYGDGSLTRIGDSDRWQGRVPVTPSGEIQLSLTDKVGNRRGLFGNVQIDNNPPSGGTIAPASGARVRGTFTSTLTGVTDLSGYVKAELRANGALVGTDTTAPYALAVKTGSFSGNLTLSWKVTDRWGLSQTLPARSVVVDNAGPSVTITKAPRNKAKVHGTVTVYAKSTDASGVARVQLLINGKVVATDRGAAYVLKVATGTQPRTMKVQVRAYDKLGNVRYTSPRTWHRT